MPALMSVTVPLFLPVFMALAAPAGGGLDPFDEAGLAAAVWEGTPDVVAARVALIDAETARERSLLLPNPGLTATWGTIPIGERNPKDLPFSQVPNYDLSVGQFVELGKRAPRQAAARAGREEARLALLDVYRNRFLDLLQTLGDQAAATARAAVLRRLIEGSDHTLRLERDRVAKEDLAQMDVDRLQVEHFRLVSSLSDAEAAQEGAAGACARILARECPRFADEDTARRFLARMSPPAPEGDEAALAARPDVQGFAATETRARAELTLAERQKIPDPTVMAGFTHDEFVASGNQGNSLMLSLSLPLPLFDRGQPEIARSNARVALASIGRQSVTSAGRSGAVASRRQLAYLVERARRLDEQAIPLARSVAERMEHGFSSAGGIKLQDVLLARRASEELQLDRIDVAATTHAVLLDLRRATGQSPPAPGP